MPPVLYEGKRASPLFRSLKGSRPLVNSACLGRPTFRQCLFQRLATIRLGFAIFHCLCAFARCQIHTTEGHLLAKSLSADNSSGVLASGAVFPLADLFSLARLTCRLNRFSCFSMLFYALSALGTI